MNTKTILRYLESTNVNHYLTPSEVRAQLKYPKQCLGIHNINFNRTDMIGIGLQIKSIRNQKIVLCNTNYQIIFKGSIEQLELIYENITQNEQSIKIQKRRQFENKIKNKILVGYNLQHILNKISIYHSDFIDLVHLYSHGLGLPNIIPLKTITTQVLNIDIDFRYRPGRGRRNWRRIHRRDQYGGYSSSSSMSSSRSRSRQIYRNRRDQNFSQQTLQYISRQAINCLRITEKTIQNGRGILQTIPIYKKSFNNIDQILKQAQIDRQKICGLYLRGSRAIGIELDSYQYKSDWDYVCVLDTWATVSLVLVRLPKIDILLMDRKTFQIYLNSNDLPIVELYYLPPSCKIINYPQHVCIYHDSLKKSLIHHLKRSDEKLKFYGKQFYNEHMHPQRKYVEIKKISKNEQNGNKNRRQDRRDGHRDERRYGRGRFRDDYRRRNRYERPFDQYLNKHELLIHEKPQSFQKTVNLSSSYIKWKFMKIMHLQIRFLDEFLQFKEYNSIKDIKRTVQIWDEVVGIIKIDGCYKGYNYLKNKIINLIQKIFSHKEISKYDFYFCKNYEKIQRSLNRRRYRSLYQEDQSDYYQRHNTLNIYRGYIYLSSQQSIFNRAEQIDIGQSQFNIKYWIERQQYQRNQSIKLSINYNSFINKRKNKLQLQKLIESYKNIGQKYIKYLLTPYFIQNQYYYQNQTIFQQQSFNNINQQPQAFCLNNFKITQNGNHNLNIVKQAKAAIFKCHLTQFQAKTHIKTLVCLKYINIYDYSKLSEDQLSQKFNINDFQIYQKRDGLLAAMYCFDHKWYVSSKQTPDGRQVITQNGHTFREQFDRIFNLLNYKKPYQQDSNKVFLFQLLSSNIQNLIKLQNDNLILHGVRNMQTLLQQKYFQYGIKYNWNIAQKLDFNTKDLSIISNTIQHKQNCEGLILIDNNLNRIIIRNELYMKLKWQKQLSILLQKSQYQFINQIIYKNREIYYLYTSIILQNNQKLYIQLFPSTKYKINIILSYILFLNRQCSQLKSLTNNMDLNNPNLHEILSNKRMDILLHTFGYCYRTYPSIFQNRIHTSINFIKTFNFILQQLAIHNY